MIKYRSAITGEYVTEEYALENPDTTVSEEVPDEDEGTDSVIIITPPPQPSPNPPPINPTPPKEK